MPKTRQQLAAREREASEEDTENPAAASRMALVRLYSSLNDACIDCEECLEM